MSYDLSNAKVSAALHGLVWDQDAYERSLPFLKQAHLDQEQFDSVMRAHCVAVRATFDASRYTLGQRLMIAFHFLRGKPLPLEAK